MVNIVKMSLKKSKLSLKNRLDLKFQLKRQVCMLIDIVKVEIHKFEYN